MGRAEDLAKERLFEDATKWVANNEQVAYLGDPQVVEAVLRLGAAQAFELIGQYSGEELTSRLYQVALKTVKPFLGKDKTNYAPMPGWNKEGAIDTFVAKWCGVDDQFPLGRLAGAFLNMISTILDVENYAQQTGTKDEQWQWQVDAIINRYALIFTGVSPPQQDLL